MKRVARWPRWVTVAFGVLLLAVPTVFTVYPGWTRWPVACRAVVMGGWVLVAVLVVLGSDRQSRQLDTMMGEIEATRLQRRRNTGEYLMRQMLSSSVAATFGYDLDVYLPETNDRQISVRYSTKSPLDPITWTVPSGVAGFAFSCGKQVTARPPAVRDETYNLGQLEQGRSANLELVVAMPIKNASERVIGVVTVYSESVDDLFAPGSTQGYEEVQALSEAAARLLIDVCELDTDS